MTMKRLLKGISVLLLCVSFTQLAFSQTKVITGTITDDKGAPIQGASVAVKGAKGGTTTDASGAFTLTVAQAAKSLVISSVGFNQQEISIANQSTVNVSLVSAAQSLNDVVVIGYGTVRRKDATGSLTTVSSKEFNQGVITSPDQLLQNKVSGLEVTSNSGQPGAATTVRIRGNSSVRGVGNPLYVIDGVILDGRDARPSLNLGIGGFGQTPDANPLLYINPYDIQDITILKDASSTAIYGSRGADGVIVMTTKTGSSGAVKLEANASVGFNVGYMKKYDILSHGQFLSALNKYSLDTLTGSSNLNKGSSVDPMKDITQSNPIQNYAVALSGGNDNGKFRASFLASSTPGLIQGNRLNKYIGSFSGNYKFFDKRLSIDFNVIDGYDAENIVLASNTAGSQGNLISSALQWNPTSPYYNPDGSFLNLGNGTPNPMMLLKAYNDVANVNTVLGNISASFKILDNLVYKFQYSINQSDGVRNTNIDGFVRGLNPIDGNGLGIISSAGLTSQTFDHTLTYNTNLMPDLKFTALGGFEYWKSNFNNSNFGAQTFDFNLNELTLGSAHYTDILQDGKTLIPPVVFKDITTEVQSYFARVDFNYKDKYYLTGTFRADGSSKFGANNKYGYFPSVGAKWNIANEDFMKDNSLFSGLSLRATWGITGSQDFPAGASIDQYSYFSYGSAGQVNAGNPDLKWESTTQYDFGLDFQLFKGKFYGTLDYYNKDKTNILFQGIVIQPAPANATVWYNLPGHLINKGFEVSLGANIIDHKDFSWDLSVNFATNSNLMTDFFNPGSDQPIVIHTGQINGQGVSGTLGQVITNNQPIDEYYLKPFGGFDQKGNQIIGANPEFAGNPNPTNLFGVTTTLRYKKLSLVINGGGASGFLIYNNTATSVTNISGIAQGRNIDLQAYNSAEQPSSGVGASSRFLEDGSYFKLRNASLNYTIGNIGNYIKNLSVYVSGTNLFVITGFSGFDPEVNIDKSNAGYPSSSIEYIPYPTPRSVVFGVNFSL
ncbi:MAG TPA: SusC/RagA family TonB-linked outer membrane protein [Chitinophagaceae bacterium]|nr:SusC/RagA family TonB-linked outer membrane protein [Chitinophagaceae bacterium]